MITVVLGRRGCGKTTLIKGLVAIQPRLLIFDTLAEYQSSGRVFRSFVPMLTYVQSRQYIQFRAVFQPVETQDLEQSFSDFMRLCWIVGNCIIVVDEIDQVASPVSIPNELAKNLRYGRHRKLFVIAASRRAADVPRLITSQADELISFNQTEPRDIAYIEAFAGKDFAYRTMTLPRYRALIYRPFDGTVSERQSDSTLETNVRLRQMVSSRTTAKLPVVSNDNPTNSETDEPIETSDDKETTEQD